MVLGLDMLHVNHNAKNAKKMMALGLDMLQIIANRQTTLSNLAAIWAEFFVAKKRQALLIY